MKTLRGTYSTKNGYQKALFIYLKRKEDYKLKYGATSVKYKSLACKLNSKIDTYRKAIRIIERRHIKIISIADEVTNFIGKSPLKSAENKDPLIMIAKFLFIRYAIESGIQGSYLTSYLGYKRSKTPCMLRMEFIRSFDTNPKNKEMWHRFKDFIKNNR